MVATWHLLNHNGKHLVVVGILPPIRTWDSIVSNFHNHSHHRQINADHCLNRK